MAVPEGTATRVCENAPRCDVQVFEAKLNGIKIPVEAAPSPDGNLKIKPGGLSHPIAVRLTRSQQFGLQGQLHLQHLCKKKPR